MKILLDIRYVASLYIYYSTGDPPSKILNILTLTASCSNCKYLDSEDFGRSFTES